MYVIDAKMLNAEEIGYNPEDLKDLITGGKAKGFTNRVKPIFTHTADNQTVGFIKINSSDLCIAPYQRNLNQKIVDEIRSNQFYQAIGCTVHLHEVYHDGKWYYSVTDGQHRACTNPAGVMIGLTSNTLAEPIIFGIANNNKAKKNTSRDDNFHTGLYIKDSIENQIKDMVEEEFDITIQRHPNHKSGIDKKEWVDGDYYQWGGILKFCYDDINKHVRACYAKVMRYTTDDGETGTKTVYTRTPSQIHEESMNILYEIVDLVLDVFGTKDLVESKQQPDSSNRVQWFKLIQEWLFENFNIHSKGMFKGIPPFPFAEIKSAWRLNCWAKYDRNSVRNRVRPIPELSLKQWSEEAKLACAAVSKSRGRRKKFLDYVHNAYIVEERRKSAT